ncbi:hypothetical protein KAH27_09930 [bacterium]|nr:hypothetical protein [bacterium]
MKEKIMKAYRSLKLIYLFVAVVLLSSCTHSYYAPNTHMVPMFEKKGELIVTGAVGASHQLDYIDYDDCVETFEFQSAYALTDNIGILANGYYAYSDVGEEYSKGYIFEAGAGYFKSLNHLFVFETYGGFGFGNVENRYRISYYNNQAISNLDIIKYFVQPSIGLTTRYFDMAISTKFSGLNYLNFSYPNHENSMPEEDLKDLDYIERNSFSLLFEPAATIRLGYKNVKLQYQIGMSFNITNPDFPQNELMMSLGLCWIIGKDCPKK